MEQNLTHFLTEMNKNISSFVNHEIEMNRVKLPKISENTLFNKPRKQLLFDEPAISVKKGIRIIHHKENKYILNQQTCNIKCVLKFAQQFKPDILLFESCLSFVPKEIGSRYFNNYANFEENLYVHDYNFPNFTKIIYTNYNFYIKYHHSYYDGNWASSLENEAQQYIYMQIVDFNNVILAEYVDEMDIGPYQVCPKEIKIYGKFNNYKKYIHPCVIVEHLMMQSPEYVNNYFQQIVIETSLQNKTEAEEKEKEEEAKEKEEVEEEVEEEEEVTLFSILQNFLGFL